MRLKSLLTLTCIVVVLSGCGSPQERAAMYLEKAQASFDEGDYVAAKLEAQNAAQIEPKNAAVRYLMALIAEKEGNSRGMLQNLEVAVAEDPQMVAARVKLGTLYVYARFFDKAIEQLVAAEALEPGDPSVMTLSALLWLKQGDTEQGLAKLDKALEIDPDLVEAIGLKAMTIEVNQPDQALELLHAALDRLPEEKTRSLRNLQLDILARHKRNQELEQVLLALAEDTEHEGSEYQARLVRFYRQQGQLDKAEDMLRDIAAGASGDVDAKLDVVRFLIATRTPEEAIEALQAFIDKDPQDQKLVLALGDLYLHNDKHDEAIVSYANASAIDPLSEMGKLARVKLAADNINNGEIDTAKKRVAGILADDPAFPRALLLSAGLLFAEQRYEEAIADLRVLLRKEPDNQRALLLLARSEVAAGDTVLGKDSYRRLLAVNPGHGEAIQELVALMLQADEFDEAKELLSKLTEEGSGSPEAGMMMIEILVAQKDWKAAEAEARRYAIGENPNGIGDYMLGQVFEGQQRYAEAAEAYSRALEKNPGGIQILQGLARSLNAQGKKAETIARLRRSAADFPGNPGIQMILGGALMDQGKTAEARQVFESVISAHPAFSAGYVAMASLYPEDAKKRIEQYRRGLAAIPANLPLGKLLADEYQRMGRVDDLFDLYEALLTAHPENRGIANNLAEMLADLRYQDPESLARAVELADGLANTDIPAYLDTVGWVYYRSGDYEEAVNYLQRAMETLEDNPMVHYHLGMAYLAAGNRAGAKQELDKAIRLAETDFQGIEEAREALATLK